MTTRSTVGNRGPVNMVSVQTRSTGLPVVDEIRCDNAIREEASDPRVRGCEGKCIAAYVE
jgi:hypothetical protein